MSEAGIENIPHQSCVLVVEDEIFIAMEVDDVLTESGFRVLGPAASVEQALDLIADERPGLAVLDFNLGREKVTPVALALKSLGVPFVLTSASGASELARYSVLDGVANLGKPTDLTQLVNTLKSLEK